VLRDLSESLRAEATARNLFLKVEGPASLLVRGDSVKLQRIVQNLVLNAFKATDAGGVQLVWQGAPDNTRWILTVEDTGPGLRGTHATPLTRAMREATDQAHESEATQHTRDAPGERPSQATVQSSVATNDGRIGSTGAVPRELGEGIGLSIVKRLCELLGAAIELETEPGRGTRFRLTFPTDMPVPGAN
jgi:signal transduction histidine kinase